MTRVERAGLTLIRTVLGARLAGRIAAGYRRGARRRAETIGYVWSTRGRASRRHLEALRGRYAGERCFIIGNGPSLALTDLAPLRDEFTFALNRGYLLYERLGRPSTFLVAVNRHVIDQFGKEIVTAAGDTFVSWHSRDLLERTADVTYIRSTEGPRFSSDVANDGVWEGATVTYVALQLAFHMGFRQVVLIGVDHAFATAGPPHTLIVSEGPDPNHFDSSYFGKGVRWQLPDLETSEIAYRLARDRFERDGRSIVDATIGGKLRIFERVDYSQVTGGARSS